MQTHRGGCFFTCPSEGKSTGIEHVLVPTKAMLLEGHHPPHNPWISLTRTGSRGTSPEFYFDRALSCHLSEILGKLRKAQDGSVMKELLNVGKLGLFTHSILSLSIDYRLASK